jgi:spermidine/putrescine transport system substrate-binding protein
MRTTGWNMLSAAIAAIVLGLAGLPPAASGETVLHIYTWSDYFDADVVAMFEDANKCRVQIDYFDSNEAMYAKLKAGGGGYDLITPSSYMSAIMDKQGMIRALDHSLIPNLDNLDKTFTAYTEDPDMRYSVPYTRTVSGVGYNSRRVPAEALGSWDIFANADFSRRMTMLNDMRETVGAALKFLGHSLNTTDEAELAAAGEVLKKWKRNLAKFDVDEAKIGLGAGEFLVVHAYNGDVALIMEENPDIGFFIPREGSSLASDDFVVAAESRRTDLAHAFINHMLDPEVAALNMESIRYFMPNPAAVEMLDDELRENLAFNVAEEDVAKCEVIRDLGPDNAKYVKIWDMVKADE